MVEKKPSTNLSCVCASCGEIGFVGNMVWCSGALSFRDGSGHVYGDEKPGYYCKPCVDRVLEQAVNDPYRDATSFVNFLFGGDKATKKQSELLCTLIKQVYAISGKLSYGQAEYSTKQFIRCLPWRKRLFNKF